MLCTLFFLNKGKGLEEPITALVKEVGSTTYKHDPKEAGNYKLVPKTYEKDPEQKLEMWSGPVALRWH